MADFDSQLMSVFAEALEHSDPVARAAFLDTACAGNAALRERVESLLAAHAGAGRFLERASEVPPDGDDTVQRDPGLDAGTGTFGGAPSGNSTADHTPEADAGTLVAGRYKLLQQIGEGGMGAVWMADQTEPVKRRVAVKLIRADRVNSRTILSRFEAERQAIALMDHPHIAKLLDAGTTPEGVPFFVMELVRGKPLTEFCDEHRMSVSDRLDLFTKICSAVQHAHQKGIIHRDIKPSNILVESHDGKAVPKVIDFGLAKAISGLQLTEHTLFTGFGSVMGTPLYMAPEQAVFNAVDVDTRADLYALGVILYELLTGTTPLTRDAIKKAAIDEMFRLVREQDAPTPSSRLSSSESQPVVAVNRQTEPAKLSRFVRGELDWIVMKSLEKDRNRRYESANSLAKDIERFLSHEPVTAGPPTAAYRLRKFVRRNRGVVIAGSLVLLALLLGIVGTTLGLIEAQRQAGIAREAADEKERARVAEQQQRERAEHNQAKAMAETAAKEKALAAEQEQLRLTRASEAKAHAATLSERTAKQQEAAERAKAEIAYAKTTDVLDAMTSTITGDSLATQQALSAEQKVFLTSVLLYYREFAAVKGGDAQTRSRTALAAYRVGFIESRLGRKTEAVAAFRTARDGYEKLVGEFRDVPTYRHGLAMSHSSLGMMLSDLGLKAEAKEQYQSSLATSEKLVSEFARAPNYRQEQARNHLNLGTLLVELRQYTEAEEQYRKALAVREKLAVEFPKVPAHREDLAHTYHNLGALFIGRGNHLKAAEHFQKAQELLEKLTGEFPNASRYRMALAGCHGNLGVLLCDLGQFTASEEHHRKALATYARLAVEFPSVPEFLKDLADAHNNLGRPLVRLGKRPQAVEHCQTALTFRERLAIEFPAVPSYRHDLAQSHINLGILLEDLGQFVAAEEHCRTALALRQKLVEEFPKVPDYHSNLAIAHNSLANVLKQRKKRVEAEEQFHKGLAIQEKLVAEFPEVTAYRYDLGQSHNDLGALQTDLGQFPEAEKQYRKGLAFRETVAAKFPTMPWYQRGLAQSHSNLGNLLADHLGRRAEAQEHFQEAQVVLEKLVKEFARVPEYFQALAVNHNDLGVLFAGVGQRVKAEEQFRKSLKVREKLATDYPAVLSYRVELGSAYGNLGNALREGGKVAESIALFDKAISTLTPIQDPRNDKARLYLRNAYWGRAMANHQLRKFSEAVADWDRAGEFSPKQQQPYFRGLRVPSWARAGHSAEAVAELTELTKLTGWSAEQWYDFACVYTLASAKFAEKQQYADRAMELLRSAVKAGFNAPERLKADTELDVLRTRDDFRTLVAELEKKFPSVKELAPPPREK